VSIPDKLTALFNMLTREDVDAMPPAERRRFADQCRHWAEIAERPQATAPPTGVLYDLGAGTPRHE
jgi:hypothetical protein